MKTAISDLAQIVADRVSQRLEEDMMDLTQEVTTDVLLENGIELDEDGWETAMEIASRIHIIAL